MPPETPAQPYEHPITVAPADIDALGHVNNVVYLRYVQDAAIAHWTTATTEAMRAEAVWVVVRHEIDYLRQARVGDQLIARTWVGPASRRTFERRTDIRFADSGKPVVKARTLWCPISPETGRPIDPSDAIRERFSVGRMGEGRRSGDD